ncbi:MAG TPA: hypothetical protein VK735_10155 [Pseudonocardia sp.]|jgi:hypothetical protein|uniref:hypothetical protein n=1 Tax=Pseudonocardia sp. TaxID=60912 RepID=UPI002B519E2B|nr:hypothetical protein [Pseudonocardia sp.]HTF47800.1 hypothetical protein [Pseudonocardia sp.]
MERGSSKHGPRMDEELEREATEAARPNPVVRGELWPDPEEPRPRPGSQRTDADTDADADLETDLDPETGPRLTPNPDTPSPRDMPGAR